METMGKNSPMRTTLTSYILLLFLEGGDQGAEHPEDDQRENSTEAIEAAPPLRQAFCHHRAHGQGEMCCKCGI